MFAPETYAHRRAVLQSRLESGLLLLALPVIATLDRVWLRGGFPRAFVARSPARSACRIMRLARTTPFT